MLKSRIALRDNERIRYRESVVLPKTFSKLIPHVSVTDWLHSAMIPFRSKKSRIHNSVSHFTYHRDEKIAKLIIFELKLAIS